MEIKCPACGAPCAPGEKFCQNCGSKLPQPVPVEEPTAILNETPAAPVPPAAPVYAAPAAQGNYPPQQNVPNYAPKAAPAYPPQQGVPNYAPKAAPAYPPQQNVPNYAPNPAPAYAPNPAPNYAPAYGAAGYAPAAPKKKKTGLIVGLIVGAVVLIAAALLLYFLVLSPTSVTLSEEAVTMDCYDTIELTAEVSPGSALNKDVVWTSSDEDVATVWDGSVTAWEAGTCTITATTSNGKSASCTVTVVLEPSSVWLSEYWVDLEVGETLTLTADVYPENATDTSVTWSSSDSSVATVSNGIVTAVGEGSCEITATTSNGVSESCTVDVSAATEPVTDPTDPSASSDYDKYVLGDWRLTYVWDNEANEDIPADQYGMSSKLTFNADHTASMTFNTESTDELTWKFYNVDYEGDYMYGVDSEGDVMYCYYIVDNDELWFYIEDEILTYER